VVVVTAVVHDTPVAGSVDAEGLSVGEIAEGLRAWARGPVEVAAVELLAGHGRWLDRSEFRAVLWAEDDVVGLDPAELAATTFLVPASRSDLAVLQVAVELLGVKAADPLGRLLAGLDAPTTALIAEAVTRCAGGRQHRKGWS
jgi:hypothetical protein